MSRWLNQFQPFGLFVLRVVLGVAMLYYGWPKVIPASGLLHGNYMATLDHSAHYVQSLGLPRWLGYISALTEFLGGIFLILGLLTRFCALLVTINMLFALALVTGRHGYEASEYPLALAAIAFLILLTGSGKWALDRRLGIS